MKTVVDLLIIIPLLLSYIFTRTYAGILLSQIGKKNGPLRFSSVALAADDIRKDGLVRITLAGQDKEKVRFLQQTSKCILYLLIIFVVGSLLFEGTLQAKGNHLSAVYNRK